MSGEYFLSSGTVSGKDISGSGKVPDVKRQYVAQMLSTSPSCYRDNASYNLLVYHLFYFGEPYFSNLLLMAYSYN
jgi:hypothetical protein